MFRKLYQGQSPLHRASSHHHIITDLSHHLRLVTSSHAQVDSGIKSLQNMLRISMWDQLSIALSAMGKPLVCVTLNPKS